MARYSTVTPALATTTTATLSAPASGLFTKFTGTSYTVTIGDPVLYSGQSQTFYNAASGTITLQSGGSGTFVGPGSSGTSTQDIITLTTLVVYSDGTNWVCFGGGGPISGTTGTFTSTFNANGSNAAISLSPTGTGTVSIQPAGGLTINPTTAGNINNTNIGASTRGTGAFTTVAANGAVTMTAGTDASSNTVGGTLTVTGGIAASGKIYSGGGFNGNVTGNVSGSSGSCTGTSLNATNIATTGGVTTAGTYYPVFVDSNGSGNQASKTAAAFTFNAGTGTLTATIVTASSDARLKENVKPITGALGLVNKLEGVLFNRIGSQVEEIGVIAQQVEAVVPQLVFTDENGMKSVAYANTVGLLIEAIKEQQVQIEELKKKVG